MIEVGLCFISYFLIFYSHGIPASALPRTTDYFKSGAPIFKVSDELEFTEEQQLEIIKQVNAAWFMCVVANFSIFGYARLVLSPYSSTR